MDIFIHKGKKTADGEFDGIPTPELSALVAKAWRKAVELSSEKSRINDELKRVEADARKMEAELKRRK